MENHGESPLKNDPKLKQGITEELEERRNLGTDQTGA